MSPGMRAARALFPVVTAQADDGVLWSKERLQESAAIIERETGVAELVAANKLLEPIHSAANRVLELYYAQYIQGLRDGGRVAHAMKQLADAVATASKAYPRAALTKAQQ